MHRGTLVIAEMICSKCRKESANFVTPCGHSVHTICLSPKNLRCPECERVFSKFEVFWDIFRDSGLNPSEEFYKEHSGFSNWKKGLAVWLIDNDPEGLQSEKIQDRLKHLFWDHEIFGFQYLILEESLLKGGLRLAKSAKYYKPNPELMVMAIRKSSVEMVKFFHESGINFNESCLHWACKNNSPTILNYIIENGIELSNGEELITSTIYNNNLANLELILKYGVKPSHKNFETASYFKNIEIFKLLINYDANPSSGNENNWLHKFNFLFLSNNLGKLNEIIDYFLKFGVDLDALDGKGESILYNLCGNDINLPIIEKLIEFGVSINALKTNNKMTPLTLACRSGCINIVRCLLRNNVNVNECDGSGLNCYLSAILSGNLEIIKITLAFSEKNFVDQQGNGPFYYICRPKSEKIDLEIFEYLTAQGVNMNILNKKRRHPLFYLSLGEKKYKVLIEKYCESEENIKFQHNLSLEDISSSLWFLSGSNNFELPSSMNTKRSKRMITRKKSYN